MQFPNPFAMTIPRSPDAEGSSGDVTYTTTAGDGGDGDGGSDHYNPDQPRDWHGRWSAGPDERGSNRNLLESVESSQTSLPSTTSSSLLELASDSPGSYYDRDGRLVLIIGGVDGGTGNGLDTTADVPTWKAGVFAGQPGAWQGFTGAVAGLPEMGDAEAFSYGEIFAAEGGNRVDPTSKYKTSSGITIGALMDARKSVPGLGGVATPDQLTARQRAAIYRDYLDKALSGVEGGHRALEAVENRYAASALADTLFRFGPTGGTKLIQDAMNKVMPGVVGIDGRMGPGTFGVYREFAANPATRGRLLDALYDARAEFLKNREEDRNQHFRYLRQR